MSLSLRTLLASSVLALAGAVALPGMAQAATFSIADSSMSLRAKSETGSKKPRKAKAGKKAKGGGITFSDGSAESRSERDRRLTRECKGRSNSGVCEGYTR
jgi:hypothetical protein